MLAGGTAFPVEHAPANNNGQVSWFESGLNQREYVAIEAMKALIPFYEKQLSLPEAESAIRALGGAPVEGFVAARAFEYADALIKASL